MSDALLDEALTPEQRGLLNRDALHNMIVWDEFTTPLAEESNNEREAEAA